MDEETEGSSLHYIDVLDYLGNQFYCWYISLWRCGIRREFFDDATKAIATFPAFKLLEGSDHRKLPAYNSTSVHSGLMEVFGRLIGHGILQSFIGFPCFAPPVYWYIATGDVHKALCYVTVDDVRDEEAWVFIEKVLLQKPACKILN